MGVLRDRPATEEELRMAQDNMTLSLPGSRETSGAVAQSIIDLVHYNLPDDYYETFTAKVRAVTTSDLRTAAERLIHPNGMVWVVVGDRSKVESGIKELNLGDIRFIDSDGNAVQ
jgi:zinc protease